MQRLASSLTMLTVFAVVVALATPSAASAQDAPHCPKGQTAHFVLGFAMLKQQLGATMGEPIECEYVDPESGDTIQHTTTGLAYYRPAINTPIFTNGAVHYALSGGRLILWRSASIDPPQRTPDETAYMAVVGRERARVDALAGELINIRGLASRGLLDTVDVGALGTILDELVAARERLANAGVPARLSSYDDALLRSFDATIASAETLLRARLTDIPDARAAFVAESEAQAAEATRLRQQAVHSYSFALPIVIN